MGREARRDRPNLVIFHQWLYLTPLYRGPDRHVAPDNWQCRPGVPFRLHRPRRSRPAVSPRRRPFIPGPWRDGRGCRFLPRHSLLQVLPRRHDRVVYPAGCHSSGLARKLQCGGEGLVHRQPAPPVSPSISQPPPLEQSARFLSESCRQMHLPMMAGGPDNAV